jgi:hypothetical protein
MSYHPGAYSGGIRNLDDIKARCLVDEITGCWEWGMSYSDKGTPRCHVVPGVLGEKRCTTSAYRAAFLMTGKRARTHDVIFRTCRNPKCCNPEHLLALTQKAMGAKISAMGYLRGDPKRAVINNRNMAASRTPVEVVRKAEAMFAEGMLIKDIAIELGIHKQTAALICRGKHVNSSGRQQVIAGASVFGWVGQIAVNDDEARAA